MGSPRPNVREPAVSAKIAGLNYVSDRTPGIRRRTTGRGFVYIDAKGRRIRDGDTLRRIRKLSIPPAWTDVWISSDPNGHLQAAGRDARGRKQYRYHSDWRQVRDSTKFHRMVAFAEVLPRIRSRVARDLKHSALTRDRVLATIVRLLEITSIRVGNEEYRKQNNSFGLTTLRDRHVDIQGPKVRFYFRGKSGVNHQISVEDRYLARTVRRLRDLPGYELFQYVGDEGQVHSIGSSDVNEYLREISGEDFTAKDFRTWNGTVLAAGALCRFRLFSSARQARKNIVRAIESVAKRLGNTVAVCRKCYVHPAVIDAYLGKTLDLESKPVSIKRGLSADENGLLSLLRKASRTARPPALEQSLERSIRRMAKGARKKIA